MKEKLHTVWDGYKIIFHDTKVWSSTLREAIDKKIYQADDKDAAMEDALNFPEGDVLGVVRCKIQESSWDIAREELRAAKHKVRLDKGENLGGWYGKGNRRSMEAMLMVSAQ